ncbi:hypothetical protein [Brumimicrobium mesophilum]|uniref:hypothetical protein n=1 Tax=Brumimicrobium mesophilum TaxID=392717 RepID=UPI000D141332|nr:hypothetical protein [Brumimicrobium mesophilum]
MENIEITQKDKLHIAEFVFAVECDTLIKTELTRCMMAFYNSKIITERERDVVSAYVSVNYAKALDLMGDYLLRISAEQGDLIMKEYYAGKL